LQGRSIEKPSAIHGRGVEQQNESLEHFDFGVTSDCTSLGLNGTSEWQTSFDDVVDSRFDMAGLNEYFNLSIDEYLSNDQSHLPATADKAFLPQVFPSVA